MRAWIAVAVASLLLLLTAAVMMKREEENKVEGMVKLSGRWDCIDVMNGEYRVCNNVWGSGEGVGRQTIEVDPFSTYFKVVETTHSSRGVAAYPFIYKGCHWGHCTKDSGLPVKVRELRSAHSTWIISTSGVEGTWNAAYDIWFSVRGASSPEGGAELMIWVNRGGGAAPAGTKVATVEVGGYEWDVYFFKMDWNYIAYLSRRPLERVELDIKAFIDDALSRGYIDPEWYLDAIEAGFEIWRGGAGLTTLRFSAFAESNP